MTLNNPQLDPTNKLRTSSPQALIDTDFEYGTQISKWENLSTTNFRPYAYTTNIVVTGITGVAPVAAGSRAVRVLLPSTTGIAVGDPIVVGDTLSPIANGVFVVDAINANVSFDYTARGAFSNTTSIFDTYKTTVSKGSFYTSAAVGPAPTFDITATPIIKVTTIVPHGFSIGNEIQIVGITGTNPPNGAFVVARVQSPTVFYYALPTGSAVPSGLTTTSSKLYARPQGMVLHRPFDGGVIFSSNGSSNYESTIRQTRRYFRYQSGKGIQMSSGTILKPNFQLDGLAFTVTATATTPANTVTVTTKDQHNIQPGSVLTISGANEQFFNGTVSVYSVTGYNTFTYQPVNYPAVDTLASGSYYASLSSWYGAVNRLGIFDQQNGLFFEYDGNVLSAVRRSSTYQVSGRVAVTSGSNTVTQATGFTTSFSKQLVPGDYVVIRGMSYRVDAIASDTSLTVSPSYRGADNVVAAVMSKTIDVKIPQSQWNLDVMDGTGPSGYNVDLSRMQMFYIDYSWYGAGFIRWGLRGVDGDVTYVHKMANNNVNFEAYMRSGNLPGRYESTTQPPKTILSATMGASDSSLVVADTSSFPKAGTLTISSASVYEHVNYTGKTATSFTGLTRAQAGATIASGVTAVVGSNIITLATAATGLQVGQRVLSNTTNASYPDGTFVASISADFKTINLSQALTGSTPALSVTFIPMGSASGQSFTYSATAPVEIELAYPTFAPTISHWGTSVIMDGRFDDDKSILFTYGQTTITTIAAGATAALFSIRVAPSVDNGKAADFGRRDLTNRMQLVLKALGISMTQTATTNLLVTAILNGTPSTTTTWAPLTAPTSSLAQIADYAGGSTTVTGGEVTGGFLVNSTDRLELNDVRDLGNSILGGGGTSSNAGIYPDGPDTLTIVVKNVGTVNAATVLARLSWTEAQA